MTNLVQHRINIPLAVELHQPVAVLLYLNDRAVEFALAEVKAGAHLGALARLAQTLPHIIFFLRQQQKFHHRTGLFLNAVDTGGNDPGIVEDQAVTGAQIFRQILKDPMLQFAAVLVQDHQARAVSRLHRGLRDQFLGQIVIKIRSFHNYLRKSI